MRIQLAIIGIFVAIPMAHAENKTVSWFLDHPDIRNTVHQLCMNNPGEAQFTPDCLNAATAVERSATRGLVSAIPVQSLSQICAGMPAYQRKFAYCDSK